MSFCTQELFDLKESTKGTFTRSGSTLPSEEQAEVQSAAAAAAAAATAAAARRCLELRRSRRENRGPVILAAARGRLTRHRPRGNPAIQARQAALLRGSKTRGRAWP